MMSTENDQANVGLAGSVYRPLHRGFTIDKNLYDFLEHEVLSPLGLDSFTYWDGMIDIIDRFQDRNADLLATRDRLQGLIDAAHQNGLIENEGELLRRIGYIVDVGAPFTVDVDDVDTEIARLSGPQLVVPLDNARYAINAANARWMSLYDAVYGSDVLDDSGAPVDQFGYDPQRGQIVVEFVESFLDQALPLNTSSWSELVAIDVSERAPHELALETSRGPVRLGSDTEFLGFNRVRGNLEVVLRHHGLGIRIIIDRDNPVGAVHAAGICDVIVEAAITVIQDCEDSVSAVDADDKLVVYRNWLGLMRGDLTSSFTKDAATQTRSLDPDVEFTRAGGDVGVLRGRALMLVRTVGIHMYTDALLGPDNAPVPEGILDAIVTSTIALFDLGKHSHRTNSANGNIYIVKPKLHGPDEAAFFSDTVDEVERLLGLARYTIKVGLMDEERRTTLNLHESIRALSRRLVFINTGFLDRTGDEIHTIMKGGPVLSKQGMKNSPWLLAYEASNVATGLATGVHVAGQIGKGMWAKPRQMRAMYDEKIAHPKAGANCAWVPSPTAAAIHALHYHLVDVRAEQARLASHNGTNADHLLVPAIQDRESVDLELDVELELLEAAQSILGYVSRWVDQGVGCSSVPDLSGTELMEDRATLRISSQMIANWQVHGLIDDHQIEKAFSKAATVVDRQNAADPRHRRTADPSCLARQAASALVQTGVGSPNGYTEPVLHHWRREAKKREMEIESNEKRGNQC